MSANFILTFSDSGTKMYLVNKLFGQNVCQAGKRKGKYAVIR